MQILIFIIFLIIFLALLFWLLSYTSNNTRYSEWTFSNSNSTSSKLLITDYLTNKILVNTTVKPNGTNLFPSVYDTQYNVFFENSHNTDFSINLTQYTNNNPKVTFNVKEDFHIVIAGTNESNPVPFNSVQYVNNTEDSLFITIQPNISGGSIAKDLHILGNGTTTQFINNEGGNIVGAIKSSYIAIDLFACVSKGQGCNLVNLIGQIGNDYNGARFVITKNSDGDYLVTLERTF